MTLAARTDGKSHEDGSLHEDELGWHTIRAAGGTRRIRWGGNTCRAWSSSITVPVPRQKNL